MPLYAQQRDLYALAAAEGSRHPGEEAALGVRTAYVFLDSADGLVERFYDAAACARARTELEALVADIRSQRFEVSPEPNRGLCGDCPARERLCSHPRELTLRDGPPTALQAA